MSFTVGSLVRARGREWVVLPDSSEEMTMLRPLGGGDMEVTGILSGLDKSTPCEYFHGTDSIPKLSGLNSATPARPRE